MLRSVLKSAVFFVLFLGVSSAWSYAPAISAYREPGISYLDYFPKDLSTYKKKHLTAMDEAGSWTKIDREKMLDWKKADLVKEAFEKVRDTRFIKIKRMPEFDRRSSWLYPMDGCFARAGLAVRNLDEWKYPEVYKVFVFGDLAVETKNAPEGMVTWWFHVVAAVRQGDEIYIMDPSIESKRAITLKQWLSTMTKDLDNVKVSLCDSKTYYPDDDCSGDRPTSEDFGAEDQLYYLDLEWQNLLNLNRNPKDELGDFPPWLKVENPTLFP